jgi:hypothetical protein
VLQFSKVCLPLVTFLCTIAFPAGAKTFPDERPQVIVSVYDDAGVPSTVLAQAEQEAAKIFDRAGLHVIWKECSPNHGGPDALARAGERSSPGLGQESSSDLGHERSPASNPAGLRPAGRVGAPAPTWFGLENLACASVEWPTHLAVRVVPRSRLATDEVFGVAFLSARGEGCYSDIFYDRVTELHFDWNVSLADTLGNVMAHELGHLLLGSNSHSGMGIMRAHWQSEELRRLSRGGLWFTSEQADRMTGKLSRARPPGELAAHSGP